MGGCRVFSKSNKQSLKLQLQFNFLIAAAIVEQTKEGTTVLITFAILLKKHLNSPSSCIWVGG